MKKMCYTGSKTIVSHANLTKVMQCLRAHQMFEVSEAGGSRRIRMFIGRLFHVTGP